MTDQTTELFDRNAVYRHAKQREMRRVQPGWWVRSYRDDETETWFPVRLVMDTTRISDNAKITRLYVTDQFDGESVEVPNFSREQVLCLTAAEAKRAGLVDRFAAGQTQEPDRG